MYKTYENLCNDLEKEVANLEKAKGFTKESLELLYYITGTMDNLKELMEKEDMGSSGYMPYYYDDNTSGARRRDSMGRYMDSGHHYDHLYDGYSRDNSRKKMVQKLETLMDDTMSENERMAIQDCINKIQ